LLAAVGRAGFSTRPLSHNPPSGLWAWRRRGGRATCRLPLVLCIRRSFWLRSRSCSAWRTAAGRRRVLRRCRALS